MQSVFAKNNKEIFKVKFNTMENVKNFVALTESLSSDILVYSSHYMVDGRSIMGILSLALDYPVDVRVIDEKEREYLKGKLKELGIVV